MRKFSIICVLLASTMALAASSMRKRQEPQNSNAEQEVKKLEREWLDAYEQHDAAAMDRIVSSDFTITYPDGDVLTKEQIMRMIKSPRASASPGPKFTTEEVLARVYGDTVILTGRLVTQWQRAGEISKEQSRYTDTYIKRGGRWQVVASHLSNIEAAKQK